MRSDTVTKGKQQAPHRSLFNALGMTQEEMDRPLAVSYTHLSNQRCASRIFCAWDPVFPCAGKF